MAGKLTRFLNLEKARKPSDTPAHGVASRERFSGEEPPPSGDRHFRAERAAQLESGVEIDAHPDSEQPFLRCPVCEADNSKYSMRCLNCQARLDTDEVHDWNARLWAERRRQQSLEPKPKPLAPAEQRAFGETLARQVAEAERARLDWSDHTTPLGLRLLQLIPNPNTRFAVAMAMVATFFGSGLVAFVERSHPVLQATGTVVAVALLILFMPGRRNRGGFWDD